MKRILMIIFAVVLVMVPFDAFARKSGDLHFTDTLRTDKKKAQFSEAMRLAPEVFVYDSFERQGNSSVTVKGLQFNASMKRTLNSEFIASDPRLAKKLKKISRWTRPLNAVCDITVNYNYLPEGIAVEYNIRNISIMGFGGIPSEY